MNKFTKIIMKPQTITDNWNLKMKNKKKSNEKENKIWNYSLWTLLRIDTILLENLTTTALTFKKKENNLKTLLSVEALCTIISFSQNPKVQEG